MDLGSVFDGARQIQSLQKIRLISSIILYIFSLWQLEVCLVFRTVGWTTDILWIKLPNWMVVTFYMGVLSFAWLLKPIKRMDLLIWKGPMPKSLPAEKDS